MFLGLVKQKSPSFLSFDLLPVSTQHLLASVKPWYVLQMKCGDAYGASVNPWLHIQMAYIAAMQIAYVKHRYYGTWHAIFFFSRRLAVTFSTVVLPSDGKLKASPFPEGGIIWQCENHRCSGCRGSEGVYCMFKHLGDV